MAFKAFSYMLQIDLSRKFKIDQYLQLILPAIIIKSINGKGRFSLSHDQIQDHAGVRITGNTLVSTRNGSNGL